MKKRVLVSLSIVMTVLLLAACGGEKFDHTISVSLYGEHASLNATLDGFKAALKDAGLEDGKNIKVEVDSAQFEPSNSKTIAQKIANKKTDLALGIATNSSVDLVNTVTDRPILFSAVTDPVDAKIIPQMTAPGGNVTGAADTNPESIVKTMDFIAAELPDVKTVGLIINKGEPNAVVMAKVAEEQLAKHGIILVEKAVAKSAEVKQAAQSLVGKADAIYITLDNEVVNAVDSIIEVANANQIPFFSADRDSVEKGAFATFGFKYFDHGYQVGEMAVEILKNGKNPGEMDVTVPQNLDLIMNMKAAEAQGITVTDAMKNYVQDKANILE